MWRSVSIGLLSFFALCVAFEGQATTIPEIVAKTKPAVVQVIASDANWSPIRTGTGFFVSADGNLVTNFHVIQGASHISARTNSGAIFIFERLVAGSANSDVALLKFQATDVDYLQIGSSTNAVEGETVLVIGNPEGLQGTVSNGIISAFRESRSYIQITAPISPGSSGSPVLDETGQVIGMATLLFREGQNLNFAISAEVIEAAIRAGITQATPAPTPTQLSIQASKEQPWVNSLGMKFVPVPETEALFCIWDTRVQDFKVFVSDTGYNATGGMLSLGRDHWKQRGATWASPGFKQGPTSPVVGVNWDDAKAFCAWLTKKEHTAGRLPQEALYRLPTDEEWSMGVGLGHEPGATPEEKDRKIAMYPWGKQWPPPKGAGNYAGEEWRIGNEPSDRDTIEGYDDGWPRTSPVGAFAANPLGLYDMGCNVWQWCEDEWHAFKRVQTRVLGGGSWVDADPGELLSSWRNANPPDTRIDCTGFRCVVAPTHEIIPSSSAAIVVPTPTSVLAIPSTPPQGEQKGNPNYEDVESELNSTYQKLRARLTAKQKIKLRDEELQWLKERATLKNNVNAFIDSTKQRIKALEQYAPEP
jgi:Sulfatase-modifying factor enzyme 1/Trypsin-like peptidase domain